MAKWTVGSAIASLLASFLALGRATIGRGVGTLYTRLTRSSILENDCRLALLTIVREEPGIHMRELQRKAGFGWGKLHYHLAILERSNHVQLEKSGKHVLVFVTAASQDERAMSLPNGTARQILESITAHPMTRGDIQRSHRISRQLASYHALEMLRKGLVREDAAGRLVWISETERGVAVPAMD